MCTVPFLRIRRYLLFLVFIRQRTWGKKAEADVTAEFLGVDPDSVQQSTISLDHNIVIGDKRRSRPTRGHRQGFTSFPPTTHFNSIASVTASAVFDLTSPWSTLYIKLGGDLEVLIVKRAAQKMRRYGGGISSRVVACCSRKNRSFGCRGKR
ncbi:hypothetical protein BDD12DRAFT_853723 [Trichophaea hybrida]|nr:hypothetical protein BDD12DRAFT_853723 [Trichophaea hybrida]